MHLKDLKIFKRLFGNATESKTKDSIFTEV